MYLGLFEPAETRLVRELLNPGDTFIDIGAHIGWFATLGAKIVGERGQVVAFEPYEMNSAMLKYNLQQNSCTNVRVTESALGSRKGCVSLVNSGGDSGGVTALDWGSEERVEVPITTLDESEGELGPIALVKIDVEGWEAHVLRGGRKTLSRARYVLMEINRPALVQARSSPEELFDLLRNAGFTTFLPVVDSGLRRFHHSDVSNIVATRSNESLSFAGSTRWNSSFPRRAFRRKSRLIGSSFIKLVSLLENSGTARAWKQGGTR